MLVRPNILIDFLGLEDGSKTFDQLSASTDTLLHGILAQLAAHWHCNTSASTSALTQKELYDIAAYIIIREVTDHEL